MRIIRVAALIAAAACAPVTIVAADDAEEIRQLRAQVEQLSERLRVLESRAAAAPSSEPPAESIVAAATAEPDPALDWTRRLSIKGDLRARHEHLERDGLPDRERQRLRARVAVTGQPLDTVDVTVGIASGGDDPRSSNQTFGGSATRKEIGLDLAFFDWHPSDSVNVYGGKMKYAAFKPLLTTFIDGDLNPEGVAAAWRGASGVFFNAAGYWLEERGATVDSMWYVGQLGWRGRLGDSMTMGAALSYHDFANVQGQKPFYLGQSFGNSVDAAGALLHDYDLAQFAFELGFALGDTPVTLLGEYGQNLAVDELDTAWALGVVVGRTAAPGSWEIGYAYGDTAKDALFAQVIESDFADGRTDSRGHVLRAGYAIARNWVANLQLYLNDLEVTGSTIGFDRVQLDLNFKY